jgi:hypothetical protein
VVVVSLAGQEKPSGLVRERRVLVVAEVVIDASTKVLVASRQTDKARIALITIVPQKRIS